MKKYLALFLLAIIIAGCSGSDVTKNDESEQTTINPNELKQKALDHFVNGSIAE